MESTQPGPFLRLPAEIIFEISVFLDIPDVLSLRKTCNFLSVLSRDKGLWLEQLRLQQSDLPLPYKARSHELSTGLSACELEYIVTTAHRAETAWPLPRSTLVQLEGIPADKVSSDILYLTVLLDTWVLCVYGNGAVALWNISKHHYRAPSCWQLRGRGPWTSASATVDTLHNAIYLAVTGTQDRSIPGSATVLMQIPLKADVSQARAPTDPANMHMEFNDVDTLFGADSQIVRAIDPVQQLIAYSRSMFIDVVHWPSNTGITIDTHMDDLEQLWNGIIGLQFAGPYIVCIKARTLELYSISYPFPPGSSYFVPSSFGPLCLTGKPRTPLVTRSNRILQPITCLAKYTFPGTTFRGVSISSPIGCSIPADRKAMCTLSFLAHDILRGVFHYHTQIVSPSAAESFSGPPASPLLQVKLVGVYDMLAGTPGFISAAALGPQGRRGVWIERTKNVTARRVCVFSAGGSQSDAAGTVSIEMARPGPLVPLAEIPDLTTNSEDDSDEDDSVQAPGTLGAAPICASTVYEVRSYDLREDLTLVAFSEVSGRIVMGTRSGKVQVI